MTSRPIVIVLTGEPVPRTRERRGGYGSLIRATAPAFATSPWLELDVRGCDVVPDLTEASAVIVTGSAASVADQEPWMERTAARLREVVEAEIPLLGICFGHQLISHALGGRVSRNPRGREMGTVELTVARTDPVLGEAGVWLVNSTHVDSVVALPERAELLAETALEACAAARFGARAWGVQFHPEIDGEVLRDFLHVRREALEREGFAWSEALASVRDAPYGAAVIERFLTHVSGSPELAAVALGSRSET